MRYPESGDADRVPPILSEPSLFYDPPYERPVEDEFAWHLVKYLDPSVALAYQVKVETPCAPVWVDFVIEQGARRVAIEVDDVASITEPFASTRARDALLLGTGAVDVLYRIRAEDALSGLHDVLLVAARHDPSLFSERGRINLNTLASFAAGAYRPDPEAALIEVGEPRDAAIEDEETFGWPEAPGPIVMQRLSADRPGAWQAAYEDALAQFGIDPDEGAPGWARSA